MLQPTDIEASASMKIALAAPLFEAVPPKLYGGTERVVAYLADALVDLGHDVTLFAAADAATKARLVPVRDMALRLDPAPLKSEIAAHLNELRELRRRVDAFDIIHFHTELLHFPFFGDIAQRTLTTIHGRLDMKDLAETYRNWSDYPLISISNSQRAPLRFANWQGTVHHGLPDNLLPFCATPSRSYLAFLGRISPEKRPDRAIAIARRAGLRLKIAAKVDTPDRSYFQEIVKPHLDDPLIEFVGEIGDREKSEFLGNALALLFPIDWPEPFGLVLIEAMACGTPVIAWNRGSVPEIITDGVTGRLVSSEDEAVAAIEQVAPLDRLRIRREFERRFTSLAMARSYLRHYRHLSASVAESVGVRCAE
ncbi:MAG TPA: glycosyltransferase family 4 protein [Rhizomicrobium sp.]|nr:glycosyltransferase family 4 protein [Rhizomicrobium sp.]